MLYYPPAIFWQGTTESLNQKATIMGCLKKRRKTKINKHKRRKRMKANRHKKRLRYKS